MISERCASLGEVAVRFPTVMYVTLLMTECSEQHPPISPTFCKRAGQLQFHCGESAATSPRAAYLSDIKANHLTEKQHGMPTNMALYRAGYVTCNNLIVMRIFQDIRGIVLSISYQ